MAQDTAFPAGDRDSACACALRRKVIAAARRGLRRFVAVWIACGCVLSALSTGAVAQPGSAGAAESESAAGRTEADLPTTIIELFQALGIWTVPFAIVTLIAVWVAVDRVVVLRRGRVIPKPFVKRFLRLLDAGELDPAEALQICHDNDSPVAHVFAHGIRKWGKPSVEVEQAIIDGGERQVSALRKHLRLLNGAATISPLLGLLGTVWGMLEAFRDIANKSAAGGMEQLGSDIALALATTAAGLLIAIPALSVYMYLTARIDSLVMEMDDLSQQVVHCVSAEALAERSVRPRRTKPAEKPGEKSVEEPAVKKKAPV